MYIQNDSDLVSVRYRILFQLVFIHTHPYNLLLLVPGWIMAHLHKVETVRNFGRRHQEESGIL